MLDELAERLAEPVRALGILARPLARLRAVEVRAAEARLSQTADAEARENERLIADLLRSALPRDPLLRSGRRLVPAEVVGRVEGERDRVRAHLADGRGIRVGMPVVFGDAYVGRIVLLEADPESAGRHAVVELVTARAHRVGARALPDAGDPVELVVGGIEGSRHPSRKRSCVYLAVERPSGPLVSGADVFVHERFPELEPLAALAEGFRLGRTAELAEGTDAAIEPLLDFVDGLSELVVLAPPDPDLGAVEPPLPTLSDGLWIEAHPIGAGNPSPWREALRLDVGRASGIRVGAPVLAIGARLIGRVVRVGPSTCEVSFLGDPGFTLVAIARFEDDEVPRVLGRLVSLGRDPEDGSVLLRWHARVDLAELSQGGASSRRARLFSGGGDAGLKSGFYFGAALVPVGSIENAEGCLRLEESVRPRDVRGLFVRRGGASE